MCTMNPNLKDKILKWWSIETVDQLFTYVINSLGVLQKYKDLDSKNSFGNIFSP